MKLQRSIKRLLPINAILLLAGISCLSASETMAQSQPTQSSKTAEAFQYNPPKPPSGQGKPVGRREGGASRGSCDDVYTGLTALVPEFNGNVKGVTAAAEPTFFFFMPTALGPETEVELVVQDQDDEYIDRKRFKLKTESAGIVSLKLKQPIADLEVGETYLWTLSVYCDPAQRSASVYVQGELGRTSTDTLEVLPSGSFEQAAQYAEQGIWFESLTILAQLRQAEPDNLQFTQAWNNLLQQIELGSIASAELLVPEVIDIVSVYPSDRSR